MFNLNLIKLQDVTSSLQEKEFIEEHITLRKQSQQIQNVIRIYCPTLKETKLTRKINAVFTPWLDDGSKNNNENS